MSLFLTVATTNENGHLTKDNIIQALDILKAKAIAANMDPSEFKLFVSEKFQSLLRDSNMLLGSNLNADEAFKAGFVAYANGVDVRHVQIPAITTRNATSKLVEAEWGYLEDSRWYSICNPIQEHSFLHD